MVEQYTWLEIRPKTFGSFEGGQSKVPAGIGRTGFRQNRCCYASMINEDAILIYAPSPPVQGFLVCAGVRVNLAVEKKSGYSWRGHDEIADCQ